MPRRFWYGTWHMMRPVRSLIDAGRVEFYPLRASQVTRFLAKKGVDVAVVFRSRRSGKDGFCSVGVSTSYPYPVARGAHVTAEVIAPCTNQRQNGTNAESRTRSKRPPLAEYKASTPDEVSIRIAQFIEPLIPDNAHLRSDPRSGTIIYGTPWRAAPRPGLRNGRRRCGPYGMRACWRRTVVRRWWLPS